MQIETDRLRLRPFTLDDLPTVEALMADVEFMQWSVAGPLEPAEALAKLEAGIACHETHGFSKLALALKGQPELIGYCGLGPERIDGACIPELGFRLRPECRGKGYATEAARAVIEDAFGRLALPEVFAYVDPGNAPSRRVIDKLGMAYLRDVPLHGRRWRLYRLQRPA